MTEKTKSRADRTLAQQEADDRANRRDVKLTMHTIEVTRDPMTKIGTQVLDHEIPIMEALHGADNIQIISSEEVEVTDIDAGTEYDRLIRKYSRPGEDDIVQKVYGSTPRDLAEEMGLPYRTERGLRQARQQGGSLIIDNANPGPEIKQAAISRITSPVKASSTVNQNSRGARELTAQAQAKVKAANAANARPARVKAAPKAKAPAKKAVKTGK